MALIWPYTLAAALASEHTIAWVESCAPKICNDAEWAARQWNNILKPTEKSPRIPLTITIGKIDHDKTLGTFTGCTDHTCNIIIDKTAFPSLVKETLLHEIGHAMGVNNYPQTPFAEVESQFGPKSKLWIKKAHWSQQGLLMSSHIREGQHIEYADAAAVAKATNATLRGNICGSHKDCKRGHICSKMAWPSPHKCITGTAKIEATALALTAAAAASITAILMVTVKQF